MCADRRRRPYQQPTVNQLPLFQSLFRFPPPPIRQASLAQAERYVRWSGSEE